MDTKSPESNQINISGTQDAKSDQSKKSDTQGEKESKFMGWTDQWTCWDIIKMGGVGAIAYFSPLYSIPYVTRNGYKYVTNKVVNKAAGMCGVNPSIHTCPESNSQINTCQGCKHQKLCKVHNNKCTDEECQYTLLPKKFINIATLIVDETNLSDNPILSNRFKT